jgi:hypothetical protein
MNDAERQRRRRERARNGRAVLGVEVDYDTTTAALVEAGFIAEDEIDDRAKVAAALSKAVELLVTRDCTANDIGSY